MSLVPNSKTPEHEPGPEPGPGRDVRASGPTHLESQVTEPGRNMSQFSTKREPDGDFSLLTPSFQNVLPRFSNCDCFKFELGVKAGKTRDSKGRR